MSEDFAYNFDGMEPATGLGGGGPIPAGKYVAVAENAELGVSSGGYQQVALQWRIIAGEYEDRTVRDWITFAPKSGPFILAYMVAAGIEKPKGKVSPADVAPYFANKIDGRVLQLTLGLRPYTVTDEQGNQIQRQGNKILRVDATDATLAIEAGASPRDVLSEEELAEVPF